MFKPELYWLPVISDWAARLAATEADPADATLWPELVSLADARLDFLQTERLGRVLRKSFPAAPPELTTRPVRLAILGSSTLSHLEAGISVAALRRGILATTFVGEYDNYLQELLDRTSALHRFAPTHVLFALDARRLTATVAVRDSADTVQAARSAMLDHIAECWRLAREAFGCTVLHQTAMPVLPPRLGQNEQRLPGSPAALVVEINSALRDMADSQGVHLIALDQRVAQDGARHWHDPTHWARTKQEVLPAAAPVYGDLVARVLAAEQGRVSKCLVLDLDNTLWGGVIGDDGLDGVVLGQGSAEGEAFVAVQQYASDLADRGVLLAVCSKNDEGVARSVFEQHPEMVLKLNQISAFVANWDDKASNLRAIANSLNIGLDSLVLLDDNPFERNLVRGALAEVLVPEIPDDEPGLVPDLLADAGYFEALSVTDDDLARTRQYASNRERQGAGVEVTDLGTYLAGLQMELDCRPFDATGLPRIVQLINKTNQFNLTTRRYTLGEAAALMDDPSAFGLQLRLSDRFGDNGMIAVVIGRRHGHGECLIDSWLMSCRVLGRGVEQATLNEVVDAAACMGASRLIGLYRPTPKNAMVSDLYDRLGFLRTDYEGEAGAAYVLDLSHYTPRESAITVKGRA